MSSEPILFRLERRADNEPVGDWILADGGDEAWVRATLAFGAQLENDGCGVVMHLLAVSDLGRTSFRQGSERVEQAHEAPDRTQ